MARLRLPCYGNKIITFQDEKATLMGPNSLHIDLVPGCTQISNGAVDKLLIFLLERYKRIHDKSM